MKQKLKDKFTPPPFNLYYNYYQQFSRWSFTQAAYSLQKRKRLREYTKAERKKELKMEKEEKR